MSDLFFPQFEFLCLVGTLWDDFGSRCLGICGLVGLGSLGLAHNMLLLRCGELADHQHRLIPARARRESSRLRGGGLASIWAPASKQSSHVGNAGVGVVSMRGAPVALPAFATAQFKRFFDCCRATRCLLLLGGSRF